MTHGSRYLLKLSLHCGQHMVARGNLRLMVLQALLNMLELVLRCVCWIHNWPDCTVKILIQDPNGAQLTDDQ